MIPDLSLESSSSAFAGGPPSQLNAVIAYDSADAARRALGLVERLARTVEGARLDRRLWRFDVLALPAAREDALRDACGADLVVVSADRRDELPTPLRAWLDEWTSRRSPGDSALIALLRSDRSASRSRAAASLATAAARAGIDFFCHESSRPAPRRGGSIWESAAAAARSRGLTPLPPEGPSRRNPD